MARIALASARHNRDAWLTALALDGRVGRIVLGAGEPMLAQMRLAWWRDQLRADVADRPSGDYLLDLIGTCWSGAEGALVNLVDGWEALLAPRPLSAEATRPFVSGREQLAEVLAIRCDCEQARAAAGAAGRLWARADLAIHAAGTEERDLALAAAGPDLATPIALPRALRPLAVIGGLARRSLRAGGTPYLGDRLSPITALRLGLFGR